MKNGHLLGPPPRAVSPLLRLQVLFGGGAAVAGWILCAATVVFALIMFNVVQVDRAFYKFYGTLETVSGTVTGVEGTYASSTPGYRAPKGSARQIYRVRFRYVTRQGATHTGYSFARKRPWPRPGSPVLVEYPTSDPSVARIKGLQRGMVDEEILYLLIFPFAGLILGLAGTLWGARNLRLLRQGHRAQARLVAKERTQAKGVEYRLTFEFQAEDGSSHRTSVRTREPARFEDEPLEQLLYDRRRPRAAVLLDDLPGAPEITPQGDFESARPGRAKLVLIAPMLSLVLLPSFVLWWLS